MKKQDLIKLSTLVGLTLLAYTPTFIWMFDRWNAKDTYYSHGILVPFISIFIIWLKRETLGKIAKKPTNWGWVFFIIGILIHAISALLRVYFSSAFSLILVIIGLVLLFLGKKFLKELIFPILFLIFMIPLPLVAIANLSFKLKIFAAHISTIIINKLGIPAVREGSIIKTLHSYIVVEDPCSGIRSLISLIALGALMAYFSNISRIKKAILFMSSIPIAIATNVIRIVALSLVSEMYGSKLATGTFHTIMGVLVFVFAFAGLALVGKMLE
jgi:exosortase